MAHKRGLGRLGAPDRSLKDIRNNNEVIGGVTVVLTGDLRQTLPVILRGSRADEDVVTEDIESESDAVPFVLPVMEVNRAQDLNRTFKQWEGRYALFTRFNEGIIADRDTLYSGPPEVLAKYITSRCKYMETVLDPFCGSGAIAIQLAMLGRKGVTVNRRVQWIRGNNLFAYEEYLDKVEDFLRVPTAD